jgi:phosphopantetheinyl transferase (holo-ACP synthase)
MVGIGNDIIDLTFPEGKHHARFAERVLSSNELSRLSAEDDIWIFWAAKEAAYKAVAQLGDVGAFLPKQFSVDVDESVVIFGDHTLHYRVEKTLDYLHVMCATNEVVLRTKVTSAISLLPSHTVQSSDFARSQAIQGLASAVGVSPVEISISKPSLTTPPKIFYRQQELKIPLSLSHDGRYVAWMFVSPLNTLGELFAPDALSRI